MQVDVSLIVAAAGESKRFGEPKIFHEIFGRPLLFYTLYAFEKFKEISEIIVATRPEFVASVEEICSLIRKPAVVVEGGKSREESVANALKVAKGNYVLIHDGVRPCVSQRLISSILQELERYDAVIPALRPVETTLRASTEEVTRLNRDEILLVQTPQGFKKDLILTAVEKAGERLAEFSDESTLVMDVLGITPHFIDGDRDNIKVTFREDIAFILNKLIGEIRTGLGYDIHRLGVGRKLFIGGVHIEAPFGAVAHSDGDVLIHALIDALLGAAGLGDIGQHFPDTDPQYKGISSLVLLERTQKLLEQKGFWVLNIDSTVILEKPKLRPYIDQMKRKIADVLKMPAHRISIKGKRGEGMGSVGKSEAVEAIVNVLITKITQ